MPAGAHQQELALVLEKETDDTLNLDLNLFNPRHFITLVGQSHERSDIVPFTASRVRVRPGNWASLETVKLEDLICHYGSDQYESYLPDPPPSLRSIHVVLGPPTGAGSFTDTATALSYMQSCSILRYSALANLEVQVVAQDEAVCAKVLNWIMDQAEWEDARVSVVSEEPAPLSVEKRLRAQIAPRAGL